MLTPDQELVHLRRDQGSASQLFWTWISSVTAGEFVGFCAPALIGVLVMDRAESLVLAAMVVAGSIEGAVLGWSQARVLRRHIPELSARRWVLNTAVAAALAWFIGMLPSTFYHSWSRWPVPVEVVVATGLGSVLLCSIGVAQWLELRRHLPRSGQWIAATAVAWCIGLLVFFVVTSPLWHPGQPPALIVAIGVLGGLTMALTMAMTTGLALVRLMRADGRLSPSQFPGPPDERRQFTRGPVP